MALFDCSVTKQSRGWSPHEVSGGLLDLTSGSRYTLRFAAKTAADGAEARRFITNGQRRLCGVGVRRPLRPHRSQDQTSQDQDMYAIIEDGGQQFKVQEGQELDIAYRGLAAGELVTFDRVLATGDGISINLGRPQLASASVTAEVIATEQGPKLVVQKMRRRKNSRRKTGHRQLYTTVKISKITV
jgi:large subunit ribosomal protein L21